MSWSDGKPFVFHEGHTTHVWGSRPHCGICGVLFYVGDPARWIYANGADSPTRSGNFFVCPVCDGEDAEVLAARAELERRARHLWDNDEGCTYGPGFLTSREVAR